MSVPASEMQPKLLMTGDESAGLTVWLPPADQLLAFSFVLLSLK